MELTTKIYVHNMGAHDWYLLANQVISCILKTVYMQLCSKYEYHFIHFDHSYASHNQFSFQYPC